MQRSVELDLDLPKSPFSRSNGFRPEHDEEVIDWFEGIRTDLQQRINLTLSDQIYHSLVLDIMHLDEHIRRTPLEMQHVSHLIAKTKKKEYETKRDIKKAEARAYFACVSNAMKGQLDDDGKIVKGKKPTAIEIEHTIAMDKAVEEAHKTMGEVQESLIILQSYMEALHSKQIMLAGMQGRYRDVTKAEMMGG